MPDGARTLTGEAKGSFVLTKYAAELVSPADIDTLITPMSAVIASATEIISSFITRIPSHTLIWPIETGGGQSLSLLKLQPKGQQASASMPQGLSIKTQEPLSQTDAWHVVGVNPGQSESLMSIAPSQSLSMLSEQFSEAEHVPVEHSSAST